MLARHFREGRSMIRNLALAALLAASAAHAQDIKGPVKIVVGYPAGGSADVVARLVADKIKDDLKQPVVVENKVGAGGRVAAETTKALPADGTTLMIANIAVMTLAPLSFAKLNYDPVKDYAPVAHVANFQLGFAAGPATGTTGPAASMKDFVAWAQANRANASFGSPAAGSLPHFFGVLIGQGIGVELLHVPFNGSAPMRTAVLGGQIATVTDTLPDLTELHKSGKLRVLGTSGAKRSAALPDVPTMTELGFPNVTGFGWFGFYAPAGTPKPIVDRLNAAIVKAINAPDVRERITALGFEPTGTSPEEFARIMAADTARWGPVIKASGFKGDQ
jgi:tripartite-type tricarboxylate transporter receptor subunit TctC